MGTGGVGTLSAPRSDAGSSTPHRPGPRLLQTRPLRAPQASGAVPDQELQVGGDAATGASSCYYGARVAGVGGNSDTRSKSLPCLAGGGHHLRTTIISIIWQIGLWSHPGAEPLLKGRVRLGIPPCPCPAWRESCPNSWNWERTIPTRSIPPREFPTSCRPRWMCA